MFVKMGYFDLVERANLQKILEEQKFAISDLADDSKTLEVGKLLSADLMVFANILACDKTFREKTVTRNNKQETKQIPVVNAKLAVRIIDVETGAVTFSETEEYRTEGEKSDSELISTCFQEIADSLKYKIMNAYPRKAYIVKVDNKTVTIDSGKKDGLYKGMKFNAIEKEPGIKHPVTGQMLPGKKKVVATLKLTEVDESLSEGKILKGDVKPGMFVQSLDVKRPFKVEMGFDFASRPFLMNEAKFNLVYNDGYDLYNIKLEQDKRASVPAIGMHFTGFMSSNEDSRVPITLAMSYLSNTPISGYSLDIIAGYEYSVTEKFMLNLGFGGFYGSAEGKVGIVGVGNNTGAHFMYGPNSEIIKEGEDIKLKGSSVGGLVQLGFSIGLNDNVGIRVQGESRVSTKIDNWSIETIDKDGKTVTLSNNKFTNLATLPPLDFTGSSGLISIYFRY
jgi:hypothetical protein